MAYKHTLIFNVQSVQVDNGAVIRQGSFSESYYHSQFFTENDAIMKTLITNRLALCSSRVSCVGLRIVNTGVRNLSRIRKFAYAGKYSGAAEGDFPSAAAYCNGVGSNDQVHEMELRGLPDAASTAGATAAGLVDLNNRAGPFFQSLIGNAFFQPCRDLSAPSAQILNIVPGNNDFGIVTTTKPFVTSVGDEIYVLRTRDKNTKKPVKGGLFVVTVATVGNTFSIGNWRAISTVKGRVRVSQPAINTYASLKVVEINLRKVGAPVFKYRGRRATA